MVLVVELLGNRKEVVQGLSFAEDDFGEPGAKFSMGVKFGEVFEWLEGKVFEVLNGCVHRDLCAGEICWAQSLWALVPVMCEEGIVKEYVPGLLPLVSRFASCLFSIFDVDRSWIYLCRSRMKSMDTTILTDLMLKARVRPRVIRCNASRRVTGFGVERDGQSFVGSS